ncbi:MAG: hypothetical protein M1817_002607 [Caeruleum heppii]|nr:MAG: hypothetical protein M1817_002607 [Caeruleum heppii]
MKTATKKSKGKRRAKAAAEKSSEEFAMSPATRVKDPEPSQQSSSSGEHGQHTPSDTESSATDNQAVTGDSARDTQSTLRDYLPNIYYPLSFFKKLNLMKRDALHERLTEGTPNDSQPWWQVLVDRRELKKTEEREQRGTEVLEGMAVMAADHVDECAALGQNDAEYATQEVQQSKKKKNKKSAQAKERKRTSEAQKRHSERRKERRARERAEAAFEAGAIMTDESEVFSESEMPEENVPSYQDQLVAEAASVEVTSTAQHPIEETMKQVEQCPQEDTSNAAVRTEVAAKDKPLKEDLLTAEPSKEELPADGQCLMADKGRVVNTQTAGEDAANVCDGQQHVHESQRPHGSPSKADSSDESVLAPSINTLDPLPEVPSVSSNVPSPLQPAPETEALPKPSKMPSLNDSRRSSKSSSNLDQMATLEAEDLPAVIERMRNEEPPLSLDQTRERRASNKRIRSDSINFIRERTASRSSASSRSESVARRPSTTSQLVLDIPQGVSDLRGQVGSDFAICWSPETDSPAGACDVPGSTTVGVVSAATPGEQDIGKAAHDAQNPNQNGKKGSATPKIEETSQTYENTPVGKRMVPEVVHACPTSIDVDRSTSETQAQDVSTTSAPQGDDKAVMPVPKVKSPPLNPAALTFIPSPPMQAAATTKSKNKKKTPVIVHGQTYATGSTKSTADYHLEMTPVDPMNTAAMMQAQLSMALYQPIPPPTFYYPQLVPYPVVSQNFLPQSYYDQTNLANDGHHYDGYPPYVYEDVFVPHSAWYDSFRAQVPRIDRSEPAEHEYVGYAILPEPVPERMAIVSPPVLPTTGTTQTLPTIMEVSPEEEAASPVRLPKWNHAVSGNEAKVEADTAIAVEGPTEGRATLDVEEVTGLEPIIELDEPADTDNDPGMIAATSDEEQTADKETTTPEISDRTDLTAETEVTTEQQAAVDVQAAAAPEPTTTRTQTAAGATATTDGRESLPVSQEDTGAGEEDPGNSGEEHHSDDTLADSNPDDNPDLTDVKSPTLLSFADMEFKCSYCDAPCYDHNPATVLCNGCGPYSDTRYCSLKHLMFDASPHWDVCGLTTMRERFDISTLPSRYALQFPAIHDRNGWGCREWNRQRMWMMRRHSISDYTLFRDWRQSQRAGYRVRNGITPSHFIHIDQEDPQKDILNRLLNLVVYDHTLLRPLILVYRMLRQRLRSMTGNTDPDIMAELENQFASEFDLPTTRLRAMAGPRDPDLATEWSGAIGGLEPMVANFEARTPLLRLWRRDHPDPPVRQNHWGRFNGVGFAGVVPGPVEGPGPGWDGWDRYY